MGTQLPQFLAHFYCGQTAGCIKISLGLEVGLSPGDFVLDGDPAPSSKSRWSPQFSAHVYCGQTAAWIKMPLGTELDLDPNVIVLGPQLPLTKKRAEPPSPIVGPCLVAKRLDRSRWHLACSWVLVHATLCCMGTQLPSPKGGQSPQFSAHFYCDQTAGCIKMPLGMAVGLSPGGFVLDGDPAHCLHAKF